jgi:glutamine amidotransferase PdxT
MFGRLLAKFVIENKKKPFVFIRSPPVGDIFTRVLNANINIVVLVYQGNYSLTNNFRPTCTYLNQKGGWVSNYISRGK